MPKLPRFEIIPDGASTQFYVYINQLEWLAEKAQELIKYIDEGNPRVRQCINDIKKELERE